MIYWKDSLCAFNPVEIATWSMVPATSDWPLRYRRPTFWPKPDRHPSWKTRHQDRNHIPSSMTCWMHGRSTICGNTREPGRRSKMTIDWSCHEACIPIHRRRTMPKPRRRRPTTFNHPRRPDSRIALVDPAEIRRAEKYTAPRTTKRAPSRASPLNAAIVSANIIAVEPVGRPTRINTNRIARGNNATAKNGGRKRPSGCSATRASKSFPTPR
mmetsp:Transcript_22165/g.48049  ORF Transcript_22165/g.48049 Transcript_22165/m.48049 type:complete len:213 (+) Transcript_22165:1179-1817(+)